MDSSVEVVPAGTSDCSVQAFEEPNEDASFVTHNGTSRSSTQRVVGPLEDGSFVTPTKKDVSTVMRRSRNPSKFKIDIISANSPYVLCKNEDPSNVSSRNPIIAPTTPPASNKTKKASSSKDGCEGNDGSFPHKPSRPKYLSTKIKRVKKKHSHSQKDSSVEVVQSRTIHFSAQPIVKQRDGSYVTPMKKDVSTVLGRSPNHSKVKIDIISADSPYVSSCNLVTDYTNTKKPNNRKKTSKERSKKTPTSYDSCEEQARTSNSSSQPVVKPNGDAGFVILKEKEVPVLLRHSPNNNSMSAKGDLTMQKPTKKKTKKSKKSSKKSPTSKDGCGEQDGTSNSSAQPVVEPNGDESYVTLASEEVPVFVRRSPIANGDPEKPCPLTAPATEQKPTKTKKSSKKSKKTPASKEGCVDDGGPSPCKSSGPKYLPKNIKLVEKKLEEREEFLEKVEKLDTQFLQLPSEIQTTETRIPPADSGSDIMGTQISHLVIFNPELFFTSFSEHSFNTSCNMSIPDLVSFIKSEPSDATPIHYRDLSLFLTVTCDRPLFDSVSLLIEDKLRRGKFILEWNDLKSILGNFGLTEYLYSYDDAYCKALNEAGQKPPKKWNFEFLFTMIQHSMSHWSTEYLMRLCKFLSDCLFEPLLLELQSNVIQLLQRVASQLLENGVGVAEIVTFVNHGRLPPIYNRFIAQFLATDPTLIPVAVSLAYRTIASVLGQDRGEICEFSFDRIAAWLSDVRPIIGKVGLKDTYQVILLCELLASLSGFDDNSKAFLVKVLGFAENMNLTFNCFERLYFIDNIARLQNICQPKLPRGYLLKPGISII